jgi:V8-like Glu-specific endopeptidase
MTLSFPRPTTALMSGFLVLTLGVPLAGWTAEDAVCNCQAQTLSGPIPDSLPAGNSQVLKVGARPGDVPLIIGGINATPTEFVNIAKLLISSPALGGTALCTGTLINNEWVLTAAHCVTNSSNGVLLPNLQVTVEFSNGVTRSGILAVKHPTYVGFVSNPQTGSIVGDICLIKLNSPVTNITTAAIQTTAPFVGQPVTIVGYGLNGTPRGGQQSGTSGVKRFGTQTIDTVTIEQTRWNFNRPEQQSTAQGDSGGPQLNNNLAVVSVTSGLSRPLTVPLAAWRNVCFNTRADRYFTWVQDTIAANSTAKTPTATQLTSNLAAQTLQGLKQNPMLAAPLSRVTITQRP